MKFYNREFFCSFPIAFERKFWYYISKQMFAEGAEAYGSTGKDGNYGKTGDFK